MIRTFSSFALVLPTLMFALTASAQVRTAPVEIISATPLSPFSDRGRLWPSTTLTSDELNAESRSLAEGFNSIPGIQARSEGSPTLSIRGSAQTDRVLKLIDGVPLNFADGLGASDLFLPTEAIGRVMIFKNPATVFYGASAMAGALDHRLRVFDRTAVRLQAADDTGIFGTRGAFVAVPIATKTTGAPNAQVTLFHERKPGRFAYTSTTSELSGRRENNSLETTRMTGVGEFQSGQLTLKPIVIAARQEGELPGPVNAPFLTTTKSDGLLTSLEGRLPLSSTAEASLRLSDIRAWGVFDRNTATETTTTASRTQASFDLSAEYASSINGRTFADLRFDRLNASYLSPSSRFEETSFDLGQSLEVFLSPLTTLQPAIRYRSDTGDLVKAIALTREFGSGRAWIVHSDGVREASLTDRFANTSFYQGNPGLSAERSQAVEIGSRYEVGRRFGGFLEGFAVEGAVYQIDYEDLFDTRAISPNVTTKVNAGRARSRGAEASIGFGRSIWNANLAYNYLDARSLDASESLRLSPRHQASATIAAQLGAFIFEVEDTYWSPYFDRELPSNSLRELPSWNQVDLNFRTLGFKDMELKAGVLNLFDEAKELTIGYPEPQRRFYASAMYFF